MLPNVKKFLIKGFVTHSININLHTVESQISIELGKLQNKFKKNIEIGSYPFFKSGKIGVAVVLRSVNKKELFKCQKELKKIIIKKKINFFNH